MQEEGRGTGERGGEGTGKKRKRGDGKLMKDCKRKEAAMM